MLLVFLWMLLLKLLYALTVVLLQNKILILELNGYMTVLMPGRTTTECTRLGLVALASLFCAWFMWTFKKRMNINIDTWINMRLLSFYLVAKVYARLNDLATQLEHYLINSLS